MAPCCDSLSDGLLRPLQRKNVSTGCLEGTSLKASRCSLLDASQCVSQGCSQLGLLLLKTAHSSVGAQPPSGSAQCGILHRDVFALLGCWDFSQSCTAVWAALTKPPSSFLFFFTDSPAFPTAPASPSLSFTSCKSLAYLPYLGLWVPASTAVPWPKTNFSLIHFLVSSAVNWHGRCVVSLSNSEE